MGVKAHMDPCSTLISGCLTVFKELKLSHYCHADAKGERQYNFYSFFTSALVGGEWSVSHPG
jgi:hypothetical protein